MVTKERKVVTKNILIGLWVIILGSLVAVIVPSGMSTPVQTMEWQMLQTLKNDGVEATNVSCEQVPEGDHLALDFLGSGARWWCNVDMAYGYGAIIVEATLYGDGSWSLAEACMP